MTVEHKSPVTSDNVNAGFVSRNADSSSIGLVDFLDTGGIKSPYRIDIKQDTQANLTTYATNADASEISLCYATDTEAFFIVRSNALISAGGGGGGGLNKWVSATSYAIDDVIWYETNYVVYVCITANSDGAFTPAKWQKLSADALTTTYNPAGSTLLSTDVENAIDELDIKAETALDQIDEKTRDIRYSESFIVNAPSTVYTLTGLTNSITDETVAPLDGSQSAKYTVDAADAAGEIVGGVYTDLKPVDFELSGIDIDWKGDAAKGAWVLYIDESSDGVSYTELANIDLPNVSESTRVKLLYQLDSASTHYRHRYHCASAIGGEVIEWTNIKTYLDPMPTAEFVETEDYNCSDATLYSSNNLALPYFASVQKDSTGSLGVVTNDSTNGFIFTATSRCSVTMTHTNAFTSAGYYGISKNATTSELDTSIQSLTEDKVAAIVYTTASGNPLSATFSGILEVGDTLAAHCSTGETANVSGWTQGISLTAKATSSNVVWKGQAPENTENTFSAKILNNGTATISSESVSFIESVNRSASGVVDINLKAGLFTEIPAVTALPIATTTSQDRTAKVISQSLTQIQISIRDSDGTGGNVDDDFDIKLMKQGADFIPESEKVFSVPQSTIEPTVTKPMLTDNSIADMNLSDLVIGQEYELKMNVAFSASGTSTGKFLRAIHDGAEILIGGYDPAGTNSNSMYSTSTVIFTATATTITYTTVGGSLRGNGTTQETFVQLTKRNKDGFVANAAKVNHITGGVEYDTGELWAGQRTTGVAFEGESLADGAVVASSVTKLLSQDGSFVFDATFDFPIPRESGASFQYFRLDKSTGEIKWRASSSPSVVTAKVSFI